MVSLLPVPPRSCSNWPKYLTLRGVIYEVQVVLALRSRQHAYHGRRGVRIDSSKACSQSNTCNRTKIYFGPEFAVTVELLP